MIICHTAYKNQQNLFKGLQGRCIESYENCENCEIYDNSRYHIQNHRNLFEGLQGRPIQSYKNYEICHTTYKINEIYSKGCREGPSKVPKVMKFTKTAKIAEIHKTIDKVNEI